MLSSHFPMKLAHKPFSNDNRQAKNLASTHLFLVDFKLSDQSVSTYLLLMNDLGQVSHGNVNGRHANKSPR